MLRWPIRLKLLVGLGVVVGMMLILMGTSIFGLHSFHMSYLTLVDQLCELGASADLIESVYRIHAPREGMAVDSNELRPLAAAAQQKLSVYFWLLKKNAEHGSRAGEGRHELGLAFLMDDDLAEILIELDPEHKPVDLMFPGTVYFIKEHPELGPQIKPATDLKGRIEQLHDTVMQLPPILHRDFWSVLKMSQAHYQTSRVIVWTSALMVLGMLCGVTILFQRWVLFPLRFLQRGVRQWRTAPSTTRSTSNPATRWKTLPRPSTT